MSAANTAHVFVFVLIYLLYWKYSNSGFDQVLQI